MKFNRTTIVLLMVSLGLGGVVYLTEIRPDGFSLSRQDEESEEKATIFPFVSEDIIRIMINTGETNLSLQKQDENWLMTQPEKEIANEAAIVFLLNLFPQAEGKLDLPVTEARRKEYGLHQSVQTIEVTLANNDRYKLILGDANFDNTQIYAQVTFPDSANKPSSIFLLSKSFQYAIERDFNEWKK